MDRIEITIIGAGVIGLAIAAELSSECDSIVVLERHEGFGKETSSRNSEVIHSGIYYPHGSLKAELCVRGAELLYEYCKKNSVPYARLGKLIVATQESELGDLRELFERGQRNGVSGLRLISGEEAARIEPAVSAISAIYSPNTGIVDAHALMKSLYNSAAGAGTVFSFNSEVDSIECSQDGYIISIKNEDYRFHSRIVINSAGLSADLIAGLAGIDVDSAGYRQRYCKGSYFSYHRKSPVGMLVYPLPHKDLSGLGVHATLDLGHRLRFGPDTEYVNTIDYAVDPGRRDAFYESASKYIKGLDREAFVSDMSGIRPKLRDERRGDFVIRHESDRGLKGLINLIGIESPGLTASLSIARHVSKLALK
ncbi:MAG TPA: NAD(P)/FAD-dependent oxidoreductase [Thermodesulfovibrionales bacterium]|nr:NAD(P)/FAD-dependent oxidoreductase [Thermodesulfovibrionales bacterium]